MITIYISSLSSVLPLWKRTFDIVLCAAAMPFLAVLMAIQFIVTTANPGPIFFRQIRVGHRGRRFYLYKFRTMGVGAPTAVHQAHFSQLMRSNAPLQKLDAVDSRLLPGAWLWRATGLDELPQIINVLRGEMSIVGPRPCIPYEYDQYSAAQRERLNSVPGLTGLWQVSGKNRTTFDQMVQLDVAYARRCCAWLDLKIILLTLPAIWRQVVDTRCARRAAGMSAEMTTAASDVAPGLRHKPI
jgi:lipopolysaccharide/colanic/teichoic acid biosynthesis glycosyltransferase